jgi:hypothetical protein
MLGLAGKSAIHNLSLTGHSMSPAPNPVVFAGRIGVLALISDGVVSDGLACNGIKSCVVIV